MGKGHDLYDKAKNLIPGISQLISKRPDDALSDVWPSYYERAKGCEIWDLDGKKYIDMSHMSVGTCLLGYADYDVNNAVKNVVDQGNMSTLLAPEEVELAELLCEIHPWADMVRYTRSGGESLAVAVRIARAKTRKDVVLCSGYHGWHDWYLAANLSDDSALNNHLRPHLKPYGVPKSLKGTVYPFDYNDTKGFLNLLERFKDDIGTVVMEPIRNVYPEKGFLETIRDVTRELGIVLIFDEVSSGWRLNHGGAHLLFGVDPDVAVFGKGMSNGYPMGAVIGNKEVMESVNDTFISSTYWTDRVGPAAALVSLKKMKEKDVHKHINNMGEKVQDIWNRLAKKHQVDITVEGIYPLSKFHFNHSDQTEIKRQFVKIALEENCIASLMYYPSFAHKDEHLDKYENVVDKAFNLISKEY